MPSRRFLQLQLSTSVRGHNRIACSTASFRWLFENISFSVRASLALIPAWLIGPA